MTSQTLETSIGAATVLHRLALGVECRDALSDRPVTSQVVAILERPRPFRDWPGRPLRRAGAGAARFTLLYPQPLPTGPVLRIDDPTRQYVPRRFTVHPRTLAQLSEPSPYVEVAARVVRLRLWPGSAYRLPRTATTVRGRVLRDGTPARWCRVLAVGPTGADAGRAHTDERGEFLLVITDAGQNPVADTVTIDLSLIGVKTPPPIDEEDRCADLVVEDVPASANPPLPTDLDNPVLHGIATPPGYVANALPDRSVTITVGTETNLTKTPLVFVPQP